VRKNITIGEEDVQEALELVEVSRKDFDTLLDGLD
jgi:hypothetical protein